MEDENLAQFQALTGADLTKAQQYLQLSDNNLERAVDLFFNTGGVDLLNEAPPVPTSTRPSQQRSEQEVINLDSDEDESSGTAAKAGPSMEDDEAMARRLQEEMYGGSGAGASGAEPVDAEGYRAPIARTRETLVGGPSHDDYFDDPNNAESAMLQQIRAREHERLRARMARTRRAGIFNQQPGASIWNDSTEDHDRMHASSARGGTSSHTNKATQLAEMFRPPFNLIAPFDWEGARDEGKEKMKWILVNIQDTSIFDCQVLNRDLWKDEGIRETVKEHFIFLQYNKDDPAAERYTNYYFRDRENQDMYPHIAIVDPRTGEQVKIWSGPPPPKPMEFLMQLHEFLDRYSLDVTAKNPVARRKPQERRESKIERMTEDEQMEWALKNSLEGGSSSLAPDNDPDALTRSITDLKQGDTSADAEMKVTEEDEEEDAATAAFRAIPATNPHTEPDASTPNTRIQFRHSGGRVVRRFGTADPVRRIYEWLKAEPLADDKAGAPFELVSMGKNLIDGLDASIEAAGLKNGTVMVEYTD